MYPTTEGPAPPTRDMYENILRASIPRNFHEYIDTFAEAKRLGVLSQLLRRHFNAPPGLLLNVACGPFATEFFLEELRPHKIISFDYEPAFAPAYPAFKAHGFLANTDFLIGDVRSIEFPQQVFDLIIMHDVLFMPDLDLAELLPKYDSYLRPGGWLFLNFPDVRTRWLWNMLDRELSYKRYSLPDVLEQVRGRGYTVVEYVPTGFDSLSLPSRLFKKILWYGFRQANQYAILARKI